MTKDDALRELGQRLIGRWSTEATHPMTPGLLITGSAEFEWLSGEKFLIARSSNPEPQFPDGFQIIGDTNGLKSHYFDSRGVHRIYDIAINDDGWTMSMHRSDDADSYAENAKPFSQRMVNILKDDDQTIVGVGEMSFDDKTWQDDLQITYHRER